MLAPGAPDRPIQVVDARDLAAWVMGMIAKGQPGVFNTTGPAAPLTWGEMLATCQTAAANPAQLTWVDDDFLLAQDVQPWRDLPLWVPASTREMAGFYTIDCRRPIAAGLTIRPLGQTVADTLAWLKQRDHWVGQVGWGAARETAVLQT